MVSALFGSNSSPVTPLLPHVKYAHYVLRHKWYVFWACLAMGVPFYRALWHDWTKFTPIEWNPYVHTFYHPDGTPRTVRDETGAYDPTKQGPEFARAWAHHQHNPHHWQAWVALGDGGTLNPVPIPETYLREMVADWIGAGRTHGNTDTRTWYQRNQDKMVLHPQSREMLERLLEEARQKELIP
jgi:hypothetical protein